MAVSVDEAFAAALALAAPVTGTEMLPLSEAAGRVLAADMAAAQAYPAFDHSAVDGYAVRAADCAAAPAVLPCPLRVVPGAAPEALPPGAAARIFTGGPLPQGADAVAMQEACTALPDRAGGAAVRIGTALTPGQNVRRAGEDMRPGQRLLAAGTVLDARHLAVAAAADLALLPLRRRVRVLFLSCGNELAAPGDGGRDGIAAARDSNRPMLAALLARPWIAAADLGILPDEPAVLQAALARAAERADLIVTSGGMSVGETDHLAAAVAGAGGRWAALQVAMKPGKPLGLARIGAAALLALPGNPYAAFTGAVLFGGAVLKRLSGQAAARPAGEPALLAEAVSHRAGRSDFVPARIVGGQAEGVPQVLPLGPGGSARLAPLLAADGLAEIGAALERAGMGTAVRFHRFRDLL